MIKILHELQGFATMRSSRGAEGELASIVRPYRALKMPCLRPEY